MLSLLLNRTTLTALAIVGILGASAYMGNAYGPNAKAYAKCQAETARRNAAIARVNASEEAAHAREEAARTAAGQAFMQCRNMQTCILTAETVRCLTLLSE